MWLGLIVDGNVKMGASMYRIGAHLRCRVLTYRPMCCDVISVSSDFAFRIEQAFVAVSRSLCSHGTSYGRGDISPYP